MGTSKQYSSVLVKDNCALCLPTPYFRGRAILRCYFNLPPINLCCHSSHSKVAKFCITANGDFNFIFQYWLFIFDLSYYTMLLFVIWAAVSAVAAFLTLGTRFIVHILFFCIFWHCPVLCFQNKLMMMMMMNVDFSNPTADPLGSRRPAHVSVKEGYLSKKWLFYCYWLIYHENNCR